MADNYAKKMNSKVAIIGIVGLPSAYGGFETLADNLVRYHSDNQKGCELTIWCSGKGSKSRLTQYLSASLRYINIGANGLQSIVYDLVALYQAIRSGHNKIVILGVSGAIGLPLARLNKNVVIITNIDGIEWKRQKWGFFAKMYLRLAEFIAVKYSHVIISDNVAISEYVEGAYSRQSIVIEYGGDHAVQAEANEPTSVSLPSSYALSICRIEPENNVEMILQAFKGSATPLVFVGNWSSSSYGRDLKHKYRSSEAITIVDPIYDIGALRWIRDNAKIYVHGHSAGGTNPSLVEMMHFGLPVLAYDCTFNRHTTEGKALYFKNSDDLRSLEADLDDASALDIGLKMKEIALRRYTWAHIGKAYFDLLEA